MILTIKFIVFDGGFTFCLFNIAWSLPESEHVANAELAEVVLVEYLQKLLSVFCTVFIPKIAITAQDDINKKIVNEEKHKQCECMYSAVSKEIHRIPRESIFSNIRVNFVWHGQIFAKIENILTRLSVAQVCSNYEKTGERKSTCTVPLRKEE